MKIYTATASGIVLDYLTALSLGYSFFLEKDSVSGKSHIWVDMGPKVPLYLLQYTQDWNLTGPLIGEFEVDFCRLPTSCVSMLSHEDHFSYGKNHLESFLRAFVISKLGRREIDIPDEHYLTWGL